MYIANQFAQNGLHSMTQKTGIQEALEIFGGSPSRLAKAVGNGVLRQHVEHWMSTGRVSAEKTPDVSAATGVPCERLNDKVNWHLVPGNGQESEHQIGHPANAPAEEAANG